MVAHNPALWVFSLGERVSRRRGRKLSLVVIRGGHWLGWIVAV